MKKPSDLCAAAWFQVEPTFNDQYGRCLRCGSEFWIKGLIDHVLKCWGIVK